jgi:phage replication O-like protein O
MSKGAAMTGPDRFIRLPTEVLEALLRQRLSGAQWRILFWVIRNTFGWNRPSAPFTWYRIAKDLGMSRPALYRAGQELLARGVLVLREGQLAIEIESVAKRQLTIPGLDVAGQQRTGCLAATHALPGGNEKRCSRATVFRRAKDIKDNIKTYKDRHSQRRRAQHPLGRGEDTERQHLAGAAKPIPGKYDRLSKN